MTERLHFTSLFMIGDWDAKVRSQGTPGVTGTFGLGVRNEAGQRLIEFCQENTLVIAKELTVAQIMNSLLPNSDRKSTRLNSSHNVASRMPSSA